MEQQFFATVGRIYCFPASLVVALILGVCTWIGWGLYQYARIQQSVVEEEQWVSL